MEYMLANNLSGEIVEVDGVYQVHPRGDDNQTFMYIEQIGREINTGVSIGGGGGGTSSSASSFGWFTISGSGTETQGLKGTAYETIDFDKIPIFSKARARNIKRKSFLAAFRAWLTGVGDASDMGGKYETLEALAEDFGSPNDVPPSIIPPKIVDTIYLLHSFHDGVNRYHSVIGHQNRDSVIINTAGTTETIRTQIINYESF